ncbi:GNAT family N-acetyltransferase [Ferruginibacter sp. HRS2-29]|uniref:GNAT family N-acetyltransferase n=1 Tax=Ferruginibacter sp. HRS2-29 TaxID=2487334 RepID=UPI0020CBA35F|nr:N-acetyltransferase [Ferruginibacter sp. HRS2-29]
MVILETPRLLLRRFTEADAPLIFGLNSDPEVLKYLHEFPLIDKKDAERIIRDVILPQYENDLGRWAVILKETNEFIGWCGLKYRPEMNETDLGYRFKKSSWGKGYGTEAAKHTLQYGFDKLKLKEITGRAHIENIGSLKILEKIGMKFIKEEVVDNCPVKTFVAKPQMSIVNSQ